MQLAILIPKYSGKHIWEKKLQESRQVDSGCIPYLSEDLIDFGTNR